MFHVASKCTLDIFGESIVFPQTPVSQKLFVLITSQSFFYFLVTISDTCCTILFCTRRFFFKGRNARQSRGAEASAGLDRSSGHSTNKNSTQVNGDNFSSDQSCNQSEQSNGISQNSALDEDSHNMILAMLPQLTQLFETKLLEMEKRICSRLSREVALSAQRLAKLILERTGGSRSASIDEAELDLD